MMNFIFICDCDEWVAPFTEAVLKHANLMADDIFITGCDEARIYINAEVFDETITDDDGVCGDWVDKEFTIRYEVEDIKWRAMLLSYDFYENQYITHEIMRADGSICRYTGPKYIDEGLVLIVDEKDRIKCTWQDS